MIDRRSAYGWSVVLLLMLTQVVSYVDRFLPSLLIEPLKRDLGLSQTQIGMLFGPAFALFYVTAGLPLGWLADRMPRKYILATGIVIWCATTMAAAAAQSFGALFATRVGVGLGEAAVAPCAIALIADFFSGARRARAVSLFMAGTFIGAGSAFLFGGMLVQAIGTWPPQDLPILGPTAAWRLSFLIVGAPGLLLALAMLTIRQPARDHSRVVGMRDEKVPFGEAMVFIRVNWRAYGALFLGSACSVTLGGLSFWNVSVFAEAWGWTVADIGFAKGMLYFAGGSTGTLLGLWLTTRMIAAGRRDATLLVLLIGLVLAVPTFASYAQMPNATAGIAVLLFAFVAQGMTGAAGPASLTFIAPGQMRSQATSIYYFVISVSGQMIGPPLVGWMADVLPGRRALIDAVTAEALLIGVPALIFVGLGLKHFRRTATMLENETASIARPAEADLSRAAA